ncbi:4-(cytidine 5'-diphospho)-2-C-methyl-D-erythritol kinase [Bacillus horti]|uniref:4-diphosphocytidyl-2-C-methyl-D-erythritol kinase n=1 Tax=Caldalkalibacillus horti TaxID=77523 RepID=A0ABT9W2U2_9BACI|nr:4-(cytidine 5'-diphospho)-2-C-methyl-D-erythritol kinase [Bacillus horti]MDQ0167574.1 4-diphosphocytidyl-2-C-methyl-D-erythritol kinase [Bacillus horti]
MNVSYKAPAKINLTLDVLHKRDDGYHEVEMVMTTIDLADQLHFTLREDKKIILDCSASYVPTDQRNLVYQVAKLLQERFGVEQGVSVYIEKNIPVAAGLAGGSSDAAMAIKGLNELWKLNLSIEQMAEIGAEIGSDVPFCIYGGTALATGRGEIIHPLPSPPPFWVILAKPPIGVSTGNIYRKLKASEITEHPNTERMIEAIKEKDFPTMAATLGNVLEEVTLKEHPQVQRIKERMQKDGADGVLMSGSGPTVYAITQKESKVQRLYNALKGFCRDVYVVRSIGERK